MVGVLVGGKVLTGVLVGVLIGGTGVLVGVTGVFVGVTGVLVGVTGVLVGVLTAPPVTLMVPFCGVTVPMLEPLPASDRLKFDRVTVYAPGVQEPLVANVIWATTVPAPSAAVPAKFSRAMSIGEDAPALGESTGLKPPCVVIALNVKQVESKLAVKTTAPTFKPAGVPLLTVTGIVTF